MVRNYTDAQVTAGSKADLIRRGDFHFFTDSQATNFVQLAVALVIDLGLSRWPLDFSKPSSIMLKDAASQQRGGKRYWSKEHTLDDMRAALGTFYVTSL
jgi:hypothetical protein